MLQLWQKVARNITIQWETWYIEANAERNVVSITDNRQQDKDIHSTTFRTLQDNTLQDNTNDDNNNNNINNNATNIIITENTTKDDYSMYIGQSQLQNTFSTLIF